MKAKILMKRVDSSEIPVSPDIFVRRSLSTSPPDKDKLLHQLFWLVGGVMVVVLKTHPVDLCWEYINICCTDSSRLIFLLGMLGAC